MNIINLNVERWDLLSADYAQTERNWIEVDDPDSVIERVAEEDEQREQRLS